LLARATFLHLAWQLVHLTNSPGGRDSIGCQSLWRERVINFSMSRKARILLIAIVIAILLGLAALWVIPRLAHRVGVSVPGGAPGPVELALPVGFQAAIFAEGLEKPRFMALDPDGLLFVAEMGAGRVVALPDADDDGRADEVVVVVDGLDRPSSLAFYNSWLYVGETSQVSRFRLDGDLQVVVSEIVVPDLPVGGFHVTRTVAFGPDGRMYVSVGSSCNVCEEEDDRWAAVSVYDADGGEGRIFARGLRNAVGLALHPETGDLWATNNGRDWLGDDSPPDTVYVVGDGLDYGWPYCHNGRIVDPDFGQRGACGGVERPVVELPAHSAPLGLAFYDADMFPEDYRGDLFVASHGSWNRSQPIGYQIYHVPLEGNEPTGQVSDFATGWLQDGGATAPGRPVGLVVAADGGLLVSDDKAGLIYRIGYP
jgi:glucose/arabinose dehydrogenase